MRGTDLGPWLASPPAPAARLPPAFAELEDRRMVSVGGEKLICDMRQGLCAYYDLTADPHERHNLADERPARVAALRGLLDRWLDAHLTFEPGHGRGGGPRAAGAGARPPGRRRGGAGAGRAAGIGRARRAARGGAAAGRAAAASRPPDPRCSARRPIPIPRCPIGPPSGQPAWAISLAARACKRWRGDPNGARRRCACARRWRWRRAATPAGCRCWPACWTRTRTCCCVAPSSWRWARCTIGRRCPSC